MGQPDFHVTAGDLNIYHARLIADQQITYVLQFKERLDVSRLQESLVMLVKALPILSFVLKVKGSNFRRVRLAGGVPGLTVLAGATNPQVEIQRFIGAPCDPQSELPLKLLLIRDASGDILCFKCDHVLTDAAGLKYLLFLFAEAYTQGRLTQPINPDRGLWQVLRAFPVPELVRAARRASIPRPGPSLISGPFVDQSIFIEHAHLEPRPFEQMHAAAKGHGVTINDLLLASLYQAIFDRLPSDTFSPYPVMVPVDMRRYLSEEDRGIIGNLSSAVYPSLSGKPGLSFSETLAAVKARMDALKGDQPGLGAMILMMVGAAAGGRLLHDRYRMAASRASRFINFTNFGVIDEGSCSFGNLSPEQIYGVGPIQYAPGILIALSTYRDTLHLVVQGNDHPRFQPFIREFLESILSQCRPPII
jgi:NRPS condensation-like uncharacterized protein